MHFSIKPGTLNASADAQVGDSENSFRKLKTGQLVWARGASPPGSLAKLSRGDSGPKQIKLNDSGGNYLMEETLGGGERGLFRGAHIERLFWQGN